MIRWYFDVTVRKFDYPYYPLDLLTVWLRVWQKDFIHTDLPSDWTPRSCMGNGKSTKPYDTDFGLSTGVEEHSYKELLINLGVCRKFINAFIVSRVPLFVVALLLFAQTLIMSGKEDLIERFGFTVNDSIATCSAVFFVILLTHIQVGSQFTDSSLVYIEYFYLLCAANLYIFSLRKCRYLDFIHYQDNLIPKLAYWPVILWIMAMATWWIL